MIIYLICYALSFGFARLGWFLPSSLALLLGAGWMYQRDYRATGNLIHLRGLFFLSLGGGQALSCLKLSKLQGPWTIMTWVCFLGAAAAFWLSYEGINLFLGPEKGVNWLKKQARGRSGALPWESRMELKKFQNPLFHCIVVLGALSWAAFILEAAYLGFVPLLLRGVPHAYSYFHISGVHYVTVSCVLIPALLVLYVGGLEERNKGRNLAALLITLSSFLIPILCVSRFQLIFAAGLALFTFLAMKHHITPWTVLAMVVILVPLYVLLTIARSHDVTYLNGIFEMRNPHLPIWVSQPYIYIANNYDNFDTLVRQLPAHSLGLKQLFPFFALTGLKFLFPQLVNLPYYLDKPELTTLTLIYDAYYDFGLIGVLLFAVLLGAVSCLLVRGLSRVKNPVAYLLYGQIAMYMALSFFTTWFTNPTTWFYLLVTGGIFLYIEYR